MIHTILHSLALLVILAPVTALGVVCLSGFTSLRHSESFIAGISSGALMLSLVGGVAIGLTFVLFPVEQDIRILQLSLFSWGQHQFRFGLLVDYLTLPFVLTIEVLTGIVSAFSARYLHRDPGYYRFFLLLLLFNVGMHVVTMGASLEVLFVGWEVIGLTSALLISFYFARAETIENSLRAFFAYRVGDTALLVAAVLLEMSGGELWFSPIGSGGHVAGAVRELQGAYAVGIPMLVLIASMAKSAQFPFHTWLPRAMEGPTPSSAIFYGGLSIHAGLYLILRFVFEVKVGWWFSVILIVVGFTSAVWGSLIGRVQTEIKTGLAYASMVQVGIMFIEVGLGFYQVAVAHFLGNAALRTYQILAAPSVIHEVRHGRAHDATLFGGAGSIRDVQEVLYSVAFDAGVNDGQGPLSLSRRLAAISRWLMATEERFLTALGRTRVVAFCVRSLHD